ncbi:unnamed protein product [Gadus morhua 'NCC']
MVSRPHQLSSGARHGSHRVTRGEEKEVTVESSVTATVNAMADEDLMGATLHISHTGIMGQLHHPSPLAAPIVPQRPHQRPSGAPSSSIRRTSKTHQRRPNKDSESSGSRPPQ